MFKRIDANADGKVSSAEYVAFFDAHFSTRDVNANGVLGKDEFSAAAFAYADLDHDNQLTAAEYEDFYRKQFQRRDANGDEVLTLDEM